MGVGFFVLDLGFWKEIFLNCFVLSLWVDLSMVRLLWLFILDIGCLMMGRLGNCFCLVEIWGIVVMEVIGGCVLMYLLF